MKRTEEKKLESLSPFEVKNTLVELAESNHEVMMLNAGRGNPNWVSTMPRKGFLELGHFALLESERSFTDLEGFGGHAQKEGIADRFKDFLNINSDREGIPFLKECLSYAEKELNLNSDDLVLELTDGYLGGFYPSPDRMLKNCESIVAAYLDQELCAGAPSPEGKFELFATEGGTAAMTYIFETMVENKLLAPGDKIAIGTPVFTPYLEIPLLNDFRFVEVEITADEDDNWKIPSSEIDKLVDPDVKALFIVNPSNPPSARLDSDTLNSIVDLVNNKRPDLIVLTDDVYCSFTNNFVSLAAVLPHNTIGVYSFSKYFGATGWRLGVVAMHEDNVVDEALRNLSDDKKEALKTRYSSVNLDPSKMKFIDRMVADSRVVALNHTAGLSTPQQIQMALFALFALVDHNNHADTYKSAAQGIVKRRYHTLFKDSKVKPLVSVDDENNAFYYTEIDVFEMCQAEYGDDFANWLVENYEPLDYLINLAEKKSVVLMPGGGFHAPEWSVRVSLANLPDEAYGIICLKMQELINDYYDIFVKQSS